MGGEQGRSPCQLLRGRGASPPLIQPTKASTAVPSPAGAWVDPSTCCRPAQWSSECARPTWSQVGPGGGGCPSPLHSRPPGLGGTPVPSPPSGLERLRTPEIHKTGWPQELETQETPGSVLRAFVSGRLCGADPPLIYAIPLPALCSLNYCPSASSRPQNLPVELEGWWAVPGFYMYL